jgi:hypothetical protein
VALLVTGAGVLGALALFWCVTRGRFLLVPAEALKLARQAGNGRWSGVTAQPSLGA